MEVPRPRPAWRASAGIPRPTQATERPASGTVRPGRRRFKTGTARPLSLPATVRRWTPKLSGGSRAPHSRRLEGQAVTDAHAEHPHVTVCAAAEASMRRASRGGTVHDGPPSLDELDAPRRPVHVMAYNTGNGISYDDTSGLDQSFTDNRRRSSAWRPGAAERTKAAERAFTGFYGRTRTLPDYCWLSTGNENTNRLLPPLGCSSGVRPDRREPVLATTYWRPSTA